MLFFFFVKIHTDTGGQRKAKKYFQQIKKTEFKNKQINKKKKERKKKKEKGGGGGGGESKNERKERKEK